MPSKKDPTVVVVPGPGKLAPGEVPASALSFPIGGSGDLGAHLLDPLDAHFAGAIGIPPVYLATGEALLASVGGPYDGESVLDALNSLKDLLPPRPNKIGFNLNTIPNSGIPSWGAWDSSAKKGGWTKSGLGVVSKYLTPSTGSFAVTGTLFPADRGVLAIYKSTSGNFFDAANTTLVGCLFLGANAGPSGIASANFDPSLKTGIQPAKATSPSSPGAAGTYTPSAVGRDIISLTSRLPVLQSYASFGAVYSDFGQNFYAYQLAKYSIPAVTLVTGDSGSYLVVHWKEQYATTLASILPAALTGGTLVQANCYSATPDAPAVSYEGVNRKNIFSDAISGSGVNLASIGTTPTGTLTAVPLSGVGYYTSTGLQFTTLARFNALFTNCYQTNDTASASVPAGFESALDPITSDLTDFGGSLVNYPLYDQSPARVLNNGTSTGYTTAAPPAVGDVVKFSHPTLGGLGAAIPFPYGSVRVRANPILTSPVVGTDATKYLYNGVGSSGSTATSESFSDEVYRRPAATASFLAADPLIPASPFPSATTITAGDAELQVYAGKIAYPSADFSTGFSPTGPDYSAVLAADASGKKRRYIRAVDVGGVRNAGKLVISGVAFSAFQAAGSVPDPGEVTDHPGGMIVQIKVPGQSGWLDLGRGDGSPDGDKTQDFRGCLTSSTGSTYSYSTGSLFTSDNGSGKYLLYVRITLIKNGVGETLNLDSLSWLAP